MKGAHANPCLWTLMLVALVSGCDQDLPVPTYIDSTRLLGARTEVVGDETRSTPHPGETARVSYPLVGPRPGVDMTRVRSLLVTCTFPNRYTGIPICQEFLDALDGETSGPLADLLDGNNADVDTSALRFECEGDESFAFAGVRLACLEGDPSLDLSISSTFDSPARLVRGVICDGGTPYFDPANVALFGCEGGDKTILMHDSVPVAQSEAEDNRNPPDDALALEINGLDWDPVELDMERLDEDNCASWAKAEGIPSLDPFDHEIGYVLARDAMEEVASGCEALDVEAYATAGEIGRRFTIFDSDACLKRSKKTLRDSVTWTGNDIERPNLEGTLVDFFFTLRDRRGGFVMTKRTACIFTLKGAG